MKPTLYLTDPEAMRKARSNQPRVSSEQARAQRARLQRATEPCSAAAKLVTSSRGLAKAAA